MNRIVVSPPAEEALSPADVQGQVHAYPEEAVAQAAHYKRLIVAARQAAEGELLRPLLPQGCLVRVDCLAPRIRLWNDVREVTSVTYLDADGARQPLTSAGYRVVHRADLVMVGRPPEGSAVEVEFSAGAFDDPEQVPDAIKAWMLLQIGMLDEVREVAADVQTYALPKDVTLLYLRPWMMQAV